MKRLGQSTPRRRPMKTARPVRPSDGVPTSWLDPLLTGPDAVLKGHGPWGCPDIEALLNAVRKRVQSLEAK